MLDLKDGDPRYYCYNKAEIMNVPLHQAKDRIAEKHIIKKNKLTHSGCEKILPGSRADLLCCWILTKNVRIKNCK